MPDVLQMYTAGEVSYMICLWYLTQRLLVLHDIISCFLLPCHLQQQKVEHSSSQHNRSLA